MMLLSSESIFTPHFIVSYGIGIQFEIGPVVIFFLGQCDPTSLQTPPLDAK